MRKYKLYCPIRAANPFRRMSKALKTNIVADNRLNRKFKSYGPRKVFLTDITYIPFKDSFVYLSVILDAYTEQVLSYVLSDNLNVDFVLSVQFRNLIKDIGLRQSMSRRGNCWDNAPQESFFGHMKDELRAKKKKWESFQEIQIDIGDWMNYYNNDRYKKRLGNLSPNEFYRYITTGEYPPLMPV